MLNSTFLIFFLPCYSPSNRSFPLLSKVAFRIFIHNPPCLCHNFFFSSDNCPFSARPTKETSSYIHKIQDHSCSPYWIYTVWCRKHFLWTICLDLFRLHPFEATIVYVGQSVLITAASIIQWRPYAQFGGKMLKKVLACPWLSYHKMEKWKNLVFCKGVIQTLKCST